ncbi:MAG: flagellar basal body protein, partial [Pseudomonadota bacterium]|nr:flagellar basal body protein [Pseudomonadota bacterium]
MSILNIGTSALTAAQTALSTTSNNISNINTEGYTRQRAEQVTRPANYEGNFYLGSGVTVNSVERIYDSFLATQVRSYTSQEAQQDSFLSYS